MNQQTLEKLKKNPFYKLNAKQQIELHNVERKPMIEFGVAPIHNSEFQKHTVQITRKKRVAKK